MPCDGNRHRFNIMPNIFGGEANDISTFVDQVLLTSSIFLVLRVVIATINFDGQVIRVACEIKNVGRIRMLPTKLQAAGLR